MDLMGSLSGDVATIERSDQARTCAGCEARTRQLPTDAQRDAKNPRQVAAL